MCFSFHELLWDVLPFYLSTFLIVKEKEIVTLLIAIHIQADSPPVLTQSPKLSVTLVYIKFTLITSIFMIFLPYIRQNRNLADLYLFAVIEAGG